MSIRSPLPFRLVLAAAAGVLAATLGEQMRAGSGQPPIASPVAAPRRSLRALTTEVVSRVSADNLSLVAAGVAFYGFLALFPAIAALVAVYGLVGDPRGLETQIGDLAGIVPQAALDLLSGVVKTVAEKPRGQLGVTFAVSTIIALWSARAGVASLISGLDIAHRTRETRSFLAQTTMGLLLTLGGIFIATLLVAGIAGLPALYAAAPAAFERFVGSWMAWLRWPIIAFEMIISLAILYRIAPSKPLESWRLFSAGAIVATALWMASSWAFSLYVSWSNSYDVTYGSLAGVVVMMLWLWASCLSILIGATVDAVLDDQNSGGVKG